MLGNLFKFKWKIQSLNYIKGLAYIVIVDIGRASLTGVIEHRVKLILEIAYERSNAQILNRRVDLIFCTLLNFSLLFIQTFIFFFLKPAQKLQGRTFPLFFLLYFDLMSILLLS